MHIESLLQMLKQDFIIRFDWCLPIPTFRHPSLERFLQFCHARKQTADSEMQTRMSDTKTCKYTCRIWKKSRVSDAHADQKHVKEQLHQNELFTSFIFASPSWMLFTGATYENKEWYIQISLFEIWYTDKLCGAVKTSKIVSPTPLEKKIVHTLWILDESYRRSFPFKWHSSFGLLPLEPFRRALELKTLS